MSEEIKIIVTVPKNPEKNNLVSVAFEPEIDNDVEECLNVTKRAIFVLAQFEDLFKKALEEKDESD